MRRARFGRHVLPLGTLTFAVLLGVASSAAAHKHQRAVAAESLSTAPAPGAAASDMAPPRAKSTAAAPFVMPPVRKALLEHPHNRVVHFPLALGLAAALLLLLARRRPELEVAGRGLVWLAALGGVAAYFSGRLQEEAFEGEPKAWLVDLHEKWGLATAIALVAWALLTLWKPARKHAWLWGLVAAALLLITGFYGGVVAHGE